MFNMFNLTIQNITGKSVHNRLEHAKVSRRIMGINIFNTIWFYLFFILFFICECVLLCLW